MSEEEPKIIVDDDWKSQVQKEKEQLAQEANEPEAADSNMPPMPPASFPILISTLSTQALAAMGFIPDPASGKPNINRDLSKHFIDTIGMLEEKTEGNLTDEEKSLISETLHQLRMAFVSSKDMPEQTGNDDTPPASTIELP